MLSVIKFIAGVVPALAGACLAILGISNIASSLVHRANAFFNPNYLHSVLLLFWLFLALAGAIACMIAWMKDLRRNMEPNKWLITGLATWILTCVALMVIVVIEFRNASFMRFEDLLAAGLCCSSVVVTTFLLIREIRLFRTTS